MCEPNRGFPLSYPKNEAVRLFGNEGDTRMWYRKNVYRVEGWGRLLAGALMALCGVYGFHLTPLGWLLVGTGVYTAATGLFGYCPACAMVGRKPVESA